MRKVPWIACRTRIEIRKHRSDRFAQNDRSRRFEAFHGVRIVTRHEVLEELRTHRRAEILRVKDVLDSDWNSMEWPAKLFLRRFGLAFSRFSQNVLMIHRCPCLDTKLHLAHAGK